MRWWKKRRRDAATERRSGQAGGPRCDAELERDIAQIRVCMDQNLTAIREVLDSWPAQSRIEYAACLAAAASDGGNSPNQRLAALMQYTAFQMVRVGELEAKALGIGQ